MKIHLDIINSIIKIAESQSGLIVRLIVWYILGSLTTKITFPQGTLESIQLGMEQLGIILITVFWGWFEVWLSKNYKKGAEVIQELLNSKLPENLKLEIDGFIGNKTVDALVNTEIEKK